MVNHIHQALAQVRELKQHVIERQKFRGYSGRARMVSGVLSLGGAVVMSRGYWPQADPVTVACIGWGIVCLLAMSLNYGALLYWFLYNRDVNRDWRKLRPALDALAPLAAGALLTAALIVHGHFDVLFGMWMAFVGLANLASRHFLPSQIVWVGLYYLAASVVCLFWPGIRFTDAWVMGIIFCVGELSSGYILHFDQTRYVD